MIVEAPDGKIIDFGELPPDQVTATMQKLYPPQTSPGQQMVDQNKVEMMQGLPGAAKQVGAYGLNALQAIPFSDEAISAVGAAFGGGEGEDFGSRYTNLQQRQQAFRDAGRELNPGANALGTFSTGLLATPLMPGGMAAKSLAGAVGKGAAVGAGYGALYGAGEGDAFASGEDSFVKRAKNAGFGAGVGGAVGAAMPLIGAAAKKTGQAVGLLDKPAERMTAEELRSKAHEAYKLAEQNGATLTPNITNEFIDDISSVVPQSEFGKAIAGENEVSKVVQRLQSFRNKPISYTDALEGDKELGSLIDNFVDRTTGKMSDQGRRLYDIQTKFRQRVYEANPMQKDAAELWARQARLRDIEKIIERAELMDHPVTGLKTGFRNLYVNKNRLRGFSAEEKQAIKEAADSGILTNLLRIFGSRLTTVGSTVAGSAAGGPLGGLASGLATEAISGTSRNLANKMQMNKAQNVLDLVSGYSKPPVSTGFPATNAAVQGANEYRRQQ